jgi:hypothetical protein
MFTNALTTKKILGFVRDESCKQLIKELRDPIPASPGQRIRYNYQYQRNEKASLYKAFEP